MISGHLGPPANIGIGCEFDQLRHIGRTSGSMATWLGDHVLTNIAPSGAPGEINQVLLRVIKAIWVPRDPGGADTQERGHPLTIGQKPGFHLAYGNPEAHLGGWGG